MESVLLHGTHGGLDPVPLAVGAAVGVGIWRLVRWVSKSRSRRGGGGNRESRDGRGQY